MTDIKSYGGPAFPLIIVKTSDAVTGAPTESDVFSGLSARDYFAAAALQGMCCNGYIPASGAWEKEPSTGFLPKDYAAKAYELADAMLKARQP